MTSSTKQIWDVRVCSPHAQFVTVSPDAKMDSGRSTAGCEPREGAVW
jgi:hypothetical protein